MIDRDPLIKKRGSYLSCLEDKGALIDIHWIAQKATLFVSLLQNLFCIDCKTQNPVLILSLPTIKFAWLGVVVINIH